jgi:nucleoporin SEH1
VHILSHLLLLLLPTQSDAHATLDGASASLVSHALQQGLQQQQQQQQQGAAGSTGSQSRSGFGNREADGGWTISWCKDRYWGEIIAAGCGTNGLIKVYIQLCSPSPFLLNPLIFRLYS